jgi:hypothetical protein
MTDTKQEKQPNPLNQSKYSRYMNMLLELDEIPWWYNILASLFTWLLLAGYIVFPGAFISISNSRVLSQEASAASKDVVKVVHILPVLLVASLCYGAGAVRMFGL